MGWQNFNVLQMIGENSFTSKQVILSFSVDAYLNQQKYSTQRSLLLPN